MDAKKKEGCASGVHKSAEWPDVLAKLNFYPKAINNPGVKEEERKVGVGTLIAHSDFFKEIVNYEKPLEKLAKLKEQKDLENKLIEEPRYIKCSYLLKLRLIY